MSDTDPLKHLNRFPLKSLWSYVVAAGLVLTATVLTRQLRPILGELSPLFFTAVMISTWLGGFGPGMFATALAGWASSFYFFDFPKGTGIFGWDDTVRLCIFLMISLLTSSLMHLRTRAEDALRRANDQLEQRVLERTSELESSNRMVRESEEGFRALVDGVTDSAICMLDTDGKVIRWNSGAERIQGYKETQIIGTSFSCFYTEDDQERNKPVMDLLQAKLMGKCEDEGWRVRCDGSRFWSNIIISVLRDDLGALRGFAHVARDSTEVKRLQNQVLEISEQEQIRIGHDLHDGLGQQLTGIAFLSQNLQRLLAKNCSPGEREADRITAMVSGAIEQTRELAKGLSPVEWGPDGLVAALRNLTRVVNQTYGILCEFQCDVDARVEPHAAAVHLYRIAQEALTNSARHSGATRILISIQREKRDIILRIDDDGNGIIPARTDGMGLQLMPYRAKMIGALFSIAAGPRGGTAVRCVYRLPAQLNNGKAAGAMLGWNKEFNEAQTPAVETVKGPTIVRS